MTRLLYGLGRACARWRFVVLGLWLVLVVGLVIAARGAGSETTNNVTLPGTGSQSATDLLSDRFPSQAYGSNPLVVATDSGKLTDSKYSKAIGSSVSALKKTPHVTAAVSPLSDAGRQRAQQGQADRLHIGGARRRPRVDHRGRGQRRARRRKPGEEGGAPGGGRRLRRPGAVQAGHRGQRQDRDLGRDGDPVARLRLGSGDGAADRHRRARPAVRPERRDAAQPHRRRAHHRAHAGDHDRARRRDRLLAVHRHQAPHAGRRGHGGARVDSARERDRGRRGPVRGRHRRDLPSGAGGRRHPAGHDPGLHVGDRGGLRHSCRAHPAAGPVRAARIARLGAQAAVRPGPRRPGAVPVLDEVRHVDREPPLAGDDRRAGGPAGPGDPDAVDAPRPGGRRGRADRHDRAPGLRPDHEGLRGGDERAVPDLRPAEQAREAGSEEPQHDQSEREAAAAAAAADRAAGAPGGRDPAAGAAGGEAADAAAVQRARQQEEAGRAAGDRPAPPDPANRPPEDQGRQVGDAAARQQRRGLRRSTR